MMNVYMLGVCQLWWCKNFSTRPIRGQFLIFPNTMTLCPSVHTCNIWLCECRGHYYITLNFIISLLYKKFLLQILILPFRIFREPATLHTLVLLEKFKDAPQERATDHARYRTDNLIIDKQWWTDERKAQNQKHPPNLHTEMILGFDDDGMENADNDESGNGDDESDEIHIFFFAKIHLLQHSQAK